MNALLLIVSLLTGVLAEVAGSGTVNGPPQKLATESPANKRKEKETLRQIQGLVERVFRFQKVTPKVHTLVAFADFLWPIDQPYAQRLFLRALDVVDGDKANVSSIDRNRATTADLRRLRAFVITHLSKRDPALALKLRERGGNPEPLDRFRSAISALEQSGRAEQAIKLAEQGWDGALANSALTLVAFLQNLRRVEPAAADAFFMRTLDRLAGEASTNANDLLTLGTYIYNSPLLAAASDPAVRDKDGVVLYMDTGDALVVDITADRPNVSADTVRTYLRSAVNILTHPNRNVDDAPLDAAALRLLMVKAQSSIPELLPAITARLHRLGGTLDSSLDSGRFARNSSPSLDEQITDAESLSGDRRDEALFSIVFTLYQAANFTRARQLAEMISDLSGRQKVLDALDFAAAAKSVESGDAATAEEIANALPVGVARAILRVAIAAHYAKNKNEVRAMEWLTAAANDCRRLDNDRRKPYLMLGVATVLAQIDSGSALGVLKEAVSAFNSTQTRPAQWFDSIQIGAVQREFSLNLKTVDKDMQVCIDKLTQADADASMALLMTITDESVQGQSLVAFSRSIWRREVSDQ
ncbi:MAG: hypothetical protein ABR594_16610 [Pyrinomonadaceae bacterium]